MATHTHTLSTNTLTHTRTRSHIRAYTESSSQSLISRTRAQQTPSKTFLFGINFKPPSIRLCTIPMFAHTQAQTNIHRHTHIPWDAGKNPKFLIEWNWESSYTTKKKKTKTKTRTKEKDKKNFFLAIFAFTKKKLPLRSHDTRKMRGVDDSRFFL